MKRVRKLPAPTRIGRKLELGKEIIRRVPDEKLGDVVGGAKSHRACSVPPWCPAHTC